MVIAALVLMAALLLLLAVLNKRRPLQPKRVQRPAESLNEEDTQRLAFAPKPDFRDGLFGPTWDWRKGEQRAAADGAPETACETTQEIPVIAPEGQLAAFEGGFCGHWASPTLPTLPSLPKRTPGTSRWPADA